MSDIKDEDKERKQNLKNLFADRLDDLVEEKKESIKTSNKDKKESTKTSNKDKKESTKTSNKDKKESTKISNKEIAEGLQISESQLSKALYAQTELGISSLVKIAEYFNVSTDYLLGLTDLKSPKEDFKTIRKVTGLLDEAIKNLYSMNRKYDGTTYVLNLMLANPKFRVLLSKMMQYLLDMSNAGTGPYDDYKGYDTMSMQSMDIDIEKENDPYRIKNRKDLEYWHLFKITNMLQNITKEMKETYLSECNKR